MPHDQDDKVISRCGALKTLFRYAGQLTAAELIKMGSSLADGVYLSYIGTQELEGAALMITSQVFFIGPMRGTLASVGLHAGQQEGSIKKLELLLNENLWDVSAVREDFLKIAEELAPQYAATLNLTMFDHDKAEEIIKTLKSRTGVIHASGMKLACILVIPVLFLPLFIKPFLQLLRQNPTVSTVVRDYYIGYLPGIFMNLAFKVKQQLATAHNKPHYVFIFTVMEALIAAGMGALFTFGVPVWKSLGLKASFGIGLSRSISSTVTVLAFSLFLRYRRAWRDMGVGLCGSRRTEDSHRSISLALRRLWVKGYPIGIEVMLETAALFLLANMSGWLSDDALAAQQIGSEYLLIALIPLMSLGQSTGMLVRQSLGRHNTANARRFGFLSIFTGQVFSGVALTSFILLADPLISLYGNVTPEIRTMAKGLLLVNGVGVFADALRNISAGALRGYMDVRFPAVVGVISLWVIGMPLAYLLGFRTNLGLSGLFIARGISLLLSGITLLTRLCLKRSKSQPKQTRLTSVLSGEDGAIIELKDDVEGETSQKIAAQLPFFGSARIDDDEEQAPRPRKRGCCCLVL